MNVWIALIIGLILGWLIELLIDIFYWRKRHLGAGQDTTLLQQELAEVRTTNGKLQAALNSSKGTVEAWNSELKRVDSAAERWQVSSIFSESKLWVSNFISDLDQRFGSLQKDLEGKEAQINQLQADIDASASPHPTADIDALNQKIAEQNAELTRLRADLAAHKTAASGPDTDDLKLIIAKLETELDACQQTVAQLQTAETAEAPEYSGPSGLSMVWGLNTQANESLEKQGITTYNQLAATQADEVDEALTFSQKYYPEWQNPQIHTSWVEQSRFAGDGDWNGLFGYQQGNFDMASLRDDLKKMWGIGPKIEQVLNDNGIYLFSQLASVPADRITEILRQAGSRFSMSSNKLHESWPEQARLADLGKWDELKTLTSKLSWSNVN